MPRKLAVMKRKLDFQAMCDELGPEDIIGAVLQGRSFIQIKGRKTLITDRMLEAAKILMPYRLPRLNSIDAKVKNVTMTQEEWIASLDKEGGE